MADNKILIGIVSIIILILIFGFMMINTSLDDVCTDTEGYIYKLGNQFLCNEGILTTATVNTNIINLGNFTLTVEDNILKIYGDDSNFAITWNYTNNCILAGNQSKGDLCID